MYKRVEPKIEESLSWDGQKVSALTKKKKDSFLDDLFNPQSSIKETILYIAKAHTKLFGLLMLFIFPYTLGVMLFFVLFYIYTGMGLEHFLILQENYNQFEPWAIGFYLLMSVTIVGFALYSIYHVLQHKGVNNFSNY